MDDAAARLYPRFPARDFLSRAEFDNDARRTAFQQRDLDAYEQRLATEGDAVVRAGTCAPCLRACVFTSAVEGGESSPGRWRLPHWREQQFCDCVEPLDATERALTHFLQARVGVSAWTRLAVVAASPALRGRLRAMATLVEQPGAAHIALAHDIPLGAPAFDMMRETLVVGGTLVFSAVFDPAATGTTTAALGWDFLHRLRAAGFRRGAAHRFRSEELGYIGASNYIFSAEAG